MAERSAPAHVEGDREAVDREPLPRDVVGEIRRSRRHPRPTQFDYLHLRSLVDNLAAALGRVDGASPDVLDIFCGSRPYDDLLPTGARCTGLDVDDRYGLADVISRDFLPFPDASFDLVLCTEAFYYVPDPVLGVAEVRRVLRPGGSVIITVPFVWPYDRGTLEHRFTGPELAALFAGWDEVRVIENGGRSVSWATLTGWMLKSLDDRVSRSAGTRRMTRPVFGLAYAAINGVGLLLDTVERRYERGPYALPMDLMLTARRPGNG